MTNLKVKLVFILIQAALGAYSYQSGTPGWAIIAATALAWAYVIGNPVNDWLFPLAQEQPYARWPELPVLLARIAVPLHALAAMAALALAPLYGARFLAGLAAGAP